MKQPTPSLWGFCGGARSCNTVVAHLEHLIPRIQPKLLIPLIRFVRPDGVGPGSSQSKQPQRPRSACPLEERPAFERSFGRPRSWKVCLITLSWHFIQPI